MRNNVCIWTGSAHFAPQRRYIHTMRLLWRFLSGLLICSLINFYRSLAQSAKLVGCLHRKLSLSALPSWQSTNVRIVFCSVSLVVPIGSFIYLIFSSSGIIFHCLAPTPSPPTTRQTPLHIIASLGQSPYQSSAEVEEDEKAIFHPLCPVLFAHPSTPTRTTSKVAGSIFYCCLGTRRGNNPTTTSQQQLFHGTKRLFRISVAFVIKIIDHRSRLYVKRGDWSRIRRDCTARTA